MNGPLVVRRAALRVRPGGEVARCRHRRFQRRRQGRHLWQDTSGNVALWLMNGGTATSESLSGRPLVDLAGSAPAISTATASPTSCGRTPRPRRDLADERRDPDLRGASRSEPGPSWHAIGTGDFNGDGKSDILLQNTSGHVAIWEMNGATPTTEALVGAIPGPAGTSAAPATLMATVSPTSCFKTITARSRSGR